MRPFTPSHGPRRRGPRLGVHTLPFQAHPRAGTEAFCSLGAARPRLRGRWCRQRPGGTSPPHWLAPKPPRRADAARGMCPPCATAPRGRARWSRLRRFAVGAHGARSLRAKPAPRVRRLCS